MQQPPEPPSGDPVTDGWPTPERASVVAHRETVVDAPPPRRGPLPGDGPPAERRIGWGMLLALGVLALVAVGILLAYLLTHRHDTNGTTTVVVTAPAGGAAKRAVPDVRGLPAAQASQKLVQVGLNAALKRVASAKPAGTVILESPAAGNRVAKGSTVTLSIALGAPAAVPAVSGQQAAAATSTLQAAGFDVNPVTVPSAQPAGTVTAQHPAAGAMLTRGTAVRINVSGGPGATSSTGTTTTATTASAPAGPVTVPDLTGNRLQEAVQTLASAGLLASIQYIPGSDSLGIVEHQSPTPGGTAPARSHVTLNASSGPGQKTQETVPDATGQELPQAVATMNGANLRLIYVKVPVTVRSEAGKVVAQTPLAAKQAPENAQILVYLGAFKPG